MGVGVVLRRIFTGTSPGNLVPRPCPECDGSGLAHCCEGLRPGNLERREHPVFDPTRSPGSSPGQALPYDRPANGRADEE